jgi:VCBS repeat-containing protein
MKTSRFFWTFGLLTVLLVALTSPASGGQERVDVCHITGTYDFGQGEVPIGHVISIADPAYETHIAHGDPEVWELRTLPDGSEVCTATVNPVNSPPIALDDAYSTDEDAELTVAAPGVLDNDNDVDGDPLTAVLDGGPSNGTLALNSDGSFSYTPNADYSGSDSFTYVANDGTEDSDIATVTLTVNPANDAPVAADDGNSTDEDTPLTVAAPGVLGNDGDVDGDSLSAVLDIGPSHGTLELSGDGGFTYTPGADYFGADSFTYHANDDTLDSNIAIVILTVNPVNDAPTAADDAYSTDEDAELTVSAPEGVLGNDGDVDGDSLSAVLDGGPSNGTLTLNPDGSFTYTPNADYNGDDSFTYHASDGALDSGVAAVVITVNPVSEPPTEMIVFVTSATYQGQSLGGLDGADAICQDRANDAGLHS